MGEFQRLDGHGCFARPQRRPDPPDRECFIQRPPHHFFLTGRGAQGDGDLPEGKGLTLPQRIFKFPVPLVQFVGSGEPPLQGNVAESGPDREFVNVVVAAAFHIFEDLGGHFESRTLREGSLSYVPDRHVELERWKWVHPLGRFRG